MPDKPRPVCCRLCGAPMHYVDDSRFEPEFQVTLGDSCSGDRSFDSFYVHKRCWQAFLPPEEKPKNG